MTNRWYLHEGNEWTDLVEPAQNYFFRDQLRSARAVALANAEGFQAVLLAIELIGQQLVRKVGGLGDYRPKLSFLARYSPLAFELPVVCPECHTQFEVLFDEIQQARNDAVHQGAYARTLTDHAVELSIILEDSLMTEASIVSHFMVRNIVEAKRWHPISYVRQQMLSKAFSYLPIWHEEGWKLVTEYSIARMLRSTPSATDRKRRLAAPVSDSITEGGLELLEADITHPDEPIGKVVQRIRERPLLVVDAQRPEELLGLLTASDVL